MIVQSRQQMQARICRKDIECIIPLSSYHPSANRNRNKRTIRRGHRPPSESETTVFARNLGGRPKGTTDAFYRWLSSQWKKAVNLLTRPNQMMYYLDMTRRRWSTTKLNMQLMPNLHCTTSQYRLHNKTNNPLPPAPIVESVVGISHSTHPQWIVASYSHHTKGFYFQLVVVE